MPAPTKSGSATRSTSYAKSVINSTLTDDTLLPVLFEAAETDDWQAKDTWRKVNPGYGVTIQADAIAQEALEAANEPRKLNDFLRFQLNRWTNQATAWLPLEWWTACQVPALNLGALAAHEATAGLDMAQAIDYASFVVTVRVPLPPGEIATVAAVTDDTGTTTSRRRSRRGFRASARSASIPRSRLTWPSGSARGSTSRRFRRTSTRRPLATRSKACSRRAAWLTTAIRFFGGTSATSP